MTRRLIQKVVCGWPGRGRRTRVNAAVLALLVSPIARGQYAVQQTGRLLDANPQIGSGGYNPVRPMSPLAIGNALAQGSIGRGLSLQSVSPVGDPNSFRATLGSGALGAFRRDSVSAASANSPYGGLLAMPYYDPSQTVYTPGFLSGQTGFAGAYPTPVLGGQSYSPGGAAGPLDLRLDRRLQVGPLPGTGPILPGAAALQAQIAGLTPGSAPELSSSIFGPAPGPVRASGVADMGLPDLRRPVQRDVSDYARRGVLELPPEDYPPGSRPPLGTPLDLVRSGQPQHLPLDVMPDPFAVEPADRPGIVLGPQPRAEEPGRPAAARPRATEVSDWSRLTDVSMLPGMDVFTDMQLALSLAADPTAPWFRDMQAAARENPRVSQHAREIAAMQVSEFTARLREAPVRTFRGEGDSPLNNELLKAESLLEIGQYFEAARRFDVAHRLSPLNPLPMIGKGNAYLAAGEYMSAAGALIQGFERYPELSRFLLDLKGLMVGGEIVDIRRADLQRRLAHQEDARLRFLLGYLEYYGGNRESGLRDLEKAAESDRDGSIISRFPSMLKGQGQLPPPRLPAPASPPTESGPPADQPNPEGPR